ncbi:MAG TPA: hypothetical protein VIW24_20180 [Aldersonia sp.]
MTSLSLPPTRNDDASVVLRDTCGDPTGFGVVIAPRLLLTARAALPGGGGPGGGGHCGGGHCADRSNEVGLDSGALFVEIGRGLVVVGLEARMSPSARLASREVRPRVGDEVTVSGQARSVVDVDDTVVRHLGASAPGAGTPVCDARGVVIAIQSAPTIATLGNGTVVGEALRVHGVLDRLRAVRSRLDDDAGALVDELIGSGERIPLPREIAVRLGSGWVLPKSLRRSTP